MQFNLHYKQHQLHELAATVYVYQFPFCPFIPCNSLVVRMPLCVITVKQQIYCCRQQDFQGFRGGLKGWMRVQYLRTSKYILLVSCDSNLFISLHCLLKCQQWIVANYIQLWDQNSLSYGVRSQAFLMQSLLSLLFLNTGGAVWSFRSSFLSFVPRLISAFRMREPAQRGLFEGVSEANHSAH